MILPPYLVESQVVSMCLKLATPRTRRGLSKTQCIKVRKMKSGHSGCICLTFNDSVQRYHQCQWNVNRTALLKLPGNANHNPPLLTRTHRSTGLRQRLTPSSTTADAIQLLSPSAGHVGTRLTDTANRLCPLWSQQRITHWTVDMNRWTLRWHNAPQASICACEDITSASPVVSTSTYNI